MHQRTQFMILQSDVRKSRRLAATIAALALLASACGGSSGDEITAEADSAGVARSFCDAVADLGASIQNGSPATDQASAAAAAVELMPADAPDFAASYFDAIADATRLSADGRDASAAEAAWANGQHLQVATFLGGECPEDEYASVPTFQGMVAMGQSMESAGAGESATATTLADNSTDATTAATSASSESDSEAVAPGLNNIELGDSGNSTIYNMTELAAGPAFSTNATEDTIFDAAPAVGNENWLVIEILGETQANIQTSYASGLFSVISPDGERYTADRFTDSFGDRLTNLDFDGLENQSAFALFQTPDLVTSLEGWQIQVLVADEIPAFIPLSGDPVPPVEPIDLGALPGGTTTADNVYNDSQGCESVLEINVVSAAVTIEASYQNRLHRSRVGERFLVVKLDATNITDDSIHRLCDKVPTAFQDPQTRLEIDGRRQSPTNIGDLISISPGETSTHMVIFTIDADATEITLLGSEDDQVLGTWQAEIETLPGE